MEETVNYSKDEEVWILATVVETFYFGPFATPFLTVEVNDQVFNIPQDNARKAEDLMAPSSNG